MYSIRRSRQGEGGKKKWNKKVVREAEARKLREGTEKGYRINLFGKRTTLASLGVERKEGEGLSGKATQRNKRARTQKRKIHFIGRGSGGMGVEEIRRADIK